MGSQLPGAGVGLVRIGHAPLAVLSLEARVHSPKLVLCFIHALLVAPSLDPRVHSHSPRISPTAALKVALSSAHSVSYQMANV